MAYRQTSRVREQLAGRRQRILLAARQLVGEGGFADAPVAAIAQLAGVATGTVYRYFPSKSELLAEVIGDVSQRELEVVAAVVMSEGTPRDRLASAIRTFAVRALRNRRLAFALVAEPVDAKVDAIRLEYRRALGRVFETIIEQGVRAGEFADQDVGASAACVVGACIEGLIGPLSPDGSTDEDETGTLIEAIEGFCLRAVSGASGAACAGEA